jgi:hypothetical protein
MSKHCAANRKRWLLALPNVGPCTYNVKISGFTRSSIYIYDISRLRVKLNELSFRVWRQFVGGNVTTILCVVTSQLMKTDSFTPICTLHA